MRFIIENVNPAQISKVVEILKDSPALIGICVENIHATTEWIEVDRLGEVRKDELRQVVSFEFPHFQAWEDVIMPVLTTYFEGSNLVVSTPNLPGLRIEFA
jgi:hypothetical protein